ncbi:hypothetical protein MPSEU_000366300 [Mayamaea pseudoterrestris]|nr:hypothetical protein MPSEU_000366300 [Mayamaea pseudoterrestris]
MRRSFYWILFRAIGYTQLVEGFLSTTRASVRRQSFVTKIKASLPDQDESLSLQHERRNGLVVLATVPFAWGTFEPAVRYVYAMDPPIPGFVFSTLYYLVAASALVTAAIVSENTWRQNVATLTEVQRASPSSWPVLGGFELGLYLFLGNSLQVIGLKTIEADRAAFMLQLTTLFVPLLQRKVGCKIWGSCLLALAGVAVMGLEGTEDSAIDAARRMVIDHQFPTMTSSDDLALEFLVPSLSVGDLYVAAAAVMYSFHCIRLEGYAKSTSALRLAACKASVETLLSALVAAFVVLSTIITEGRGVEAKAAAAVTGTSFLASSQDAGQEIVGFFELTINGISSGHRPVSSLIPVVLAILWTGLITCGYTIYAQSYGQSRVAPVTANLIYTIQPVCTAITAWLVLGETLAPAGFAGGALIAMAVYIVAK